MAVRWKQSQEKITKLNWWRRYSYDSVMERVFLKWVKLLSTPPPTLIGGETGLVWNCVKYTRVSDQFYFFIKFLSNFSHMNVMLYYVYKALNMLIFSNLQFNYTSGINCIRKLHSKSKMGDTEHFFTQRSPTQYRRLV